MRSTILLSLVAILACAFTTGCEEDKQKIALREARKAIKSSQYDLALTKFKEFLVLAPNNYNGLWGMADVYSRQGNVKEQEKILNQIMSNARYAKNHARVLKPALEQNYVMQGNSLLGADVKGAEGFYRKALGLNKKNASANANLAELLMNQGDSAQKAAKYKVADSAFREAIKLRITSKLRNKLKKRAELSAFFIQRDSVMPRFKKVEKELIDAGRYDPKKREFIVAIEVDVEGYPGNKRDPDFEMRAKNHGRIALLNALNAVVWKVAGKERPADVASLNFSVKHLKGFGKNQGLVEKGKRKYAYKMAIRVARDAVLFHVIDIDEGRTKKRPPPPPAPAEATDAPAPTKGK